MRTVKRSNMVVLATLLALASLGFGAGTAIAVTTSKTGTSVARSTVLTQDAAAVFTSTVHTTVGSTTVFANAGHHILTRFSAESNCTGPAGFGWCTVRILIDGVEADPAVGTDFAFDSTDNGTNTVGAWASHSMERARTVTFTGTHVITVQAAVVAPANSFRLDDWALAAQVLVP